ncbi:MAG: sigma-54-dependent Fis family transcriptional regulator [Bacillota bacterium]|nr:sigma-54-dependent Fis family transcriptional regulator [Bacillota bacterium]
MRKDIQKILDSTHDAMIVVDKNSIITLFNKSAERLTGMKNDEVLGRRVDEVIDNTRLPIILKTGVSELNQKQPLNDITIITNRMPVIDDDGEIIGAIAVFRDITEMIELAEKITNLNQIRETLEATFNATQDAISVVDADGIGVLINPAYTRMTGYTESDIIGIDCTFDLAEGESVHKEVLRTGKAVKGKKLKVGLNKKEVIAEAAPIIDKGVLKGSVAIIHDLTEINEIYKQLDQAKQIIRNLEAKYTFDDIIGSSEILMNAIEKAKIAAETPATVIIRGESGTGKELFAHAIHNASNRKYAQFVRVNCAAINENLLESELFGYEEGAFTGASKGGKVGLFEKANGGTIFLDEIGELSLNTQAKLLRVLQEKEIVRVGGNKPISIDVRIISATNVDLENAILEKKFRQDLYYRLNVVPINIPSLREHKSDIPALVKHLINKYNQEYGRNVSNISPTALESIFNHEWPGNVRELENFIGRAMINIKMHENLITLSHLPAVLHKTNEKVQVNGGNVLDVTMDSLNLESCTEAFEKVHIAKVLEMNQNNREYTARELGISLRTLYYKLKKLGIND